MRFTQKKLVTALATAAVLTLTACGGGGGGGGGGIATPLTGTAAVGAALAGATVKLKDSAGTTQTTTSDAFGAYRFADVSALVAPFMLEASGTAGGVNYILHSLLSVAPAAGVAGVLNVTPATEAVVAQALGADPATVFLDATKIKAVNATQLADAKKKLLAALADVLTALGQTPANVDLFTTAFAANGTGLDKLLDMVAIGYYQDTTAGQTVYVQNKSDQAQSRVDITPATTVANVTPVAAPTAATLALNTATIKDMLAAFNAAAALPTQAEREAALAPLFDTAYLSEGRDKAAEIVDIATYSAGTKLLDIVLQGCDGATAVCKTEMAILEKDGVYSTDAMQFKFDTTTNKWLAYGNRVPFEYDLKPVVQADYFYFNGVRELSHFDTGFNFWFPAYTNTGAASTYQSVKLSVSNDNGATWTLAAQLEPKTTCSGNYLPVVDNNPNRCMNFVPVTDARAAEINAETLAGKRSFKIEAFPSSNYTGNPLTYIGRSTKQFFTAATGRAALAASGFGITDTQLGTNSVAFTGLPESLRLRTAIPNNLVTGEMYFDNPSVLNGVVSVEKANAECLASGNSADVCNSSYGLTAVIRSVFLEGRDTAGRGIWANFQ